MDFDKALDEIEGFFQVGKFVQGTHLLQQLLRQHVEQYETLRKNEKMRRVCNLYFDHIEKAMNTIDPLNK